MSEFNRVTEAKYSPTACAFCGTSEGPFIDTNVDYAGYGHVYICVAGPVSSGCIRQMARLDGMIDPEVIHEYEQREAALLAELAEAKKLLGAKRVSAADLIAALS